MPNNTTRILQTSWANIVTTFLQSYTSTSTFSPQMNTTIMTVILKSNKDPSLFSSYCPLSLINTDLEIITKASATTIETVAPILIHRVQTGFVENRNISDSTRRLFNLIHIPQK